MPHPQLESGCTSPGGLVRGLLRDERGATAVEYALIIAAIAAVIILIVIALGQKVQGLYDKANTPNW